MSVRKAKEGRWTVTARVRVNGKIVHRQETTGGTKEQARALHEKLKQAIRAGTNAPGSLTQWNLDKPRTFGELLNLYEEKRGHCAHSHWLKIQLLKRELGSIALENFTDRFDTYVKILRATPVFPRKKKDGKKNDCPAGRPRSSAAINRLVEIVRAAFNLGVGLEVLTANPITKIRFPRLKELPRDVVLNELERQNLLNTIDREAPHLSAVVRFALQVPCRRSELVNMTREDLDLINGAIRVKAEISKNDRGCWKPIPPEMMSYFQTLPKETGYLFFRTVEDKKTGAVKYFGLGSFHTSWYRCLKLAGLKGFRFHDTRHMAASALIDNGTPEQVVMTVANWKTNMLRNYYHREPKQALKLIRFAPECEGVVKGCEGKAV